MANENTNLVPSGNDPKPKRTRSVQNQAIAAYITDSLKTLRANPPPLQSLTPLQMTTSAITKP